MKKVLIAMPRYARTSRAGYRMLLDYGCEITEIPYDRDYTVEELKGIAGDFDGVIADSEKWCEETLAAAHRLKVIARFGTGMDSVDTEAAKRHGVIVTNCPGLNADTVAEQAVTLLLCAVRRVSELDRSMREGQWVRTMFHELNAGTVGILGFGNIGRKVAEKLSGFGCRLIAYDLFPNRERAEALHVEMVGYDELLTGSDYISIHMPLMPETRHSVNASFFEKIRDHAVVVNTARGALVDEAALYDALRGGKLQAYACDVFEQEPPPADLPLFTCPNYIATPHIAGETYENRERTGLATAAALIDVFEGREPRNRQV